MFNNCMGEVFTAWRVAMRRVWRVPWKTHCRLLPHLSECIDIELGFSKRCINFLDMTSKSKHNAVRMITNIGFSGLHSILGDNMKYMNSRYGINVNNMSRIWNDMFSSDNESGMICKQMRELCVWRHQSSNLLK